MTALVEPAQKQVARRADPLARLRHGPISAEKQTPKAFIERGKDLRFTLRGALFRTPLTSTLTPLKCR